MELNDEELELLVNHFKESELIAYYQIIFAQDAKNIKSQTILIIILTHAVQEQALEFIDMIIL